MGERDETLVDLLRTAEAAWGERTALAIRAGLREDAWSYTRLWRAANAVARHFREDLALSPGDRVVIWAPNGPRWVACAFGAMLARLVLVPLDPFSTGTFIEQVVARTDAALLVTGFADPAIAGTRVARLAISPSTPAAPTSASGRPATTSPRSSSRRHDGRPQGGNLTHGNILANVESAGLLIGRARFRLLSVLPLSHMLEQTIGSTCPCGTARRSPTPAAGSRPRSSRRFAGTASRR